MTCINLYSQILFFSIEVSVGGSSWDVGSDGRGSLSPASSATPTSASETDVEAAATVGVTQTTPYQCSFCDRAFPRLSYLKRHEQVSTRCVCIVCARAAALILLAVCSPWLLVPRKLLLCCGWDLLSLLV